MELKEIKLLIDLMKKNDLSVFKMEREGFKITLKKSSGYQPAISAPPVAFAPAPVAAAAAPASATPASSANEPAATGRDIVSPMVGTFYRAPSPESPAFVEEGQEVTENTVVCIIEAMKVMNEIKAEAKGIIAEILVEGGKPVQYGQPLFRLK